MAEQRPKVELEEGKVYTLILQEGILTAQKSLQRGMYTGYGRDGIMAGVHYFVVGISDRESDPVKTLVVNDLKLTRVDDKTLSSDAFLEVNLSEVSQLNRKALSLLMKKAGLI